MLPREGWGEAVPSGAAFSRSRSFVVPRPEIGRHWKTALQGSDLQQILGLYVKTALQIYVNLSATPACTAVLQVF